MTPHFPATNPLRRVFSFLEAAMRQTLSRWISVIGIALLIYINLVLILSLEP